MINKIIFTVMYALHRKSIVSVQSSSLYVFSGTNLFVKNIKLYKLQFFLLLSPLLLLGAPGFFLDDWTPRKTPQFDSAVVDTNTPGVATSSFAIHIADTVAAVLPSIWGNNAIPAGFSGVIPLPQLALKAYLLRVNDKSISTVGNLIVK